MFNLSGISELSIHHFLKDNDVMIAKVIAKNAWVFSQTYTNINTYQFLKLKTKSKYTFFLDLINPIEDKVGVHRKFLFRSDEKVRCESFCNLR